METKDFVRLQKLCEENGFEITQYSAGTSINISMKKDSWEGVEFAKVNQEFGCITIGKIYKVIINETDVVKVIIHNSIIKMYDLNKCYLDPSTEEAYIEQLKAKAFELYGEIKDGDKFDRSELNIQPKRVIIDATSSKDSFFYNKEDDTITSYGIYIYKNGIWAKKLSKRIIIQTNHTKQKVKFYSYNEKITIDNNMAHFLGEQLEKYLNKEIVV